MPTPPTDVTPLEALLAELLTAHEVLLDSIRRQRSAVSSADTAALAEATRHQTDAVSRIASLEQRRREVVVAMLNAHPEVGRRVGAQPTLSSLCPLLAEPSRQRSIDIAERLRGVLRDVQRESRGVRGATATLIAHMDGLIAQIGRRLSHDGTYARPGTPGASNRVVSGIDLTS